MPSIYDLYIRDNIMEICEAHFNEHLKDLNGPGEALTEEDRDFIRKQLDDLLTLISDTLGHYGTENLEGYDDIIDKLVGFCIISKMNEARLSRIITSMTEKD